MSEHHDHDDAQHAALQARGVESDGSRVVPVAVVLFGAFALMVGTIIICLPLVMKVTQGLVQDLQLELPTTDLDALRVVEAEALGTPKALDSGLYRIPIAAAKAILVANPALLASAGTAPAQAPADSAPADGEPVAELSEEELVAAGNALFNGAKICMACHKADSADRLVGPGLKGIFGRAETMADGTELTVDEAYLRESLTDPNAKVVQGFPAAMTPQTFTDAELTALVAFLKSL